MAGRRAISLSALLLVSLHAMQLTSADPARTYETNRSTQSEKLISLNPVANRDRIDLPAPLGIENGFQLGAGIGFGSPSNSLLGSAPLGKPGFEGGLSFGQRQETDLGLGPFQRPGLDLGSNSVQRLGFNLGPNTLRMPGMEFGHNPFQRPGFEMGPNPFQRPGFEMGPNPFQRQGFEMGPNPFQRPGFAMGPYPFQRPGFDGGFGIGQRPFPELGLGPVQRRLPIEPMEFGPGLGPRPGFEHDRDVDRVQFPGPIFRPFKRPHFPRGSRFDTADQLPVQLLTPNGQDARPFSVL